MLVHIHARIVPEEKTSFHQTASLPSPNGDSCLELRDTVEPGGIITLRDTASLKPITAAEEVIVHRCRCFCHANQRSKHTRGLYINPFRGTFFSARLRGVQGNQCELNCCAASQTSVSLRFCVPIWLRSSVITGTLTLGLPFNLHMSLTTTIVYRAPYGQLYRICSLGRPDLFHEWLSMYARGIQNVDEFGDYVLQVIHYLSYLIFELHR
jgi:hypothetical protein